MPTTLQRVCFYVAPARVLSTWHQFGCISCPVFHRRNRYFLALPLLKSSSWIPTTCIWYGSHLITTIVCSNWQRKILEWKKKISVSAIEAPLKLCPSGWIWYPPCSEPSTWLSKTRQTLFYVVFIWCSVFYQKKKWYLTTIYWAIREWSTQVMDTVLTMTALQNWQVFRLF